MMEMDIETMLFYGFIFLLILVIAVLTVLLIHSGFFTEINVQTCKPCIGEIKIAYKFATGPYKESGTLFTEIHTLLPQYRTIGVYYDDPKKKDQSRLRYIVGLILSENGEPVNEKDETTLKEWDYKFATFPSINHAVQTSFPFKSTLSIIVAIFRVYPILDEYIEMRSLCVHPFIEVYDSDKENIFFVGPLEKQDSFYVPEVLEAEQTAQAEEEEEEEDDRSSVSWDDSASYIKSEGFDSDSLAEECHPPTPPSDLSPLSESPKETKEPLEKDAPLAAPPQFEAPVSDDAPTSKTDEQVTRSPLDEDSDNNTASSFEEIDEKDAPEIREEEAPLPESLKTEL